MPVKKKNGAAALAAGKRSELSRRLEEVVGDQLDAIQRVAKLVGTEGAKDDGARAIAAVSRSLRETSQLLQPSAAEKNSGDDDEPFPYDVEQFRDELARALRGIIEDRRRELRDGSAEADPGAAGAQGGNAAD